MKEYQKQAEDFLNATATTFTKVYTGTTDEFIEGLTNPVYRITLANARHSYTFTFHGAADSINHDRNRNILSIKNNKKLTAYDVLACMNVDYSDGDFEEFCNSYGYDVFNSDGDYSRKSLEVFRAVREQTKNLCKLFTTDQLEQLAEIA